MKIKASFTGGKCNRSAVGTEMWNKKSEGSVKAGTLG